MKKETGVVAYESGLSIEKHNALAETFNPFMAEVTKLVESAKSIDVSDASDKVAMAAARKTRLELRAIRVNVEKTRKDGKDTALREGKAWDGFANIIKAIIVPVEQDLQQKEDFARIQEARRVVALVEERRQQLTQFDVDSEHFDLANMKDEAFQSLLKSSEAGHKAKVAAEQAERERQEQERIAKEKADESERAKQARVAEENAKLREEQEALQKAQAEADKKAKAEIEAQRKKAQKAQAEADALKAEAAAKEAEEKRLKAEAERAAKDAEIDRLRAAKEAEQAALAAPDAEKIMAFVDAICALQAPTVSSNEAMDAMKGARSGLNSIVKSLRVYLGKVEQST